MKEIWTIGHSNQSLDNFINLLLAYKIKVIADVRSFPGSRKFPWFNSENLQTTLPEKGIEYIHLKDLGGRRKVNPQSHNTAWESPQFRGYADYMETEQFTKGIDQLTNIASQKRTAFMCSEVLWWRCHRSMISDYLKIQNWTVIHIVGIDKTQEHPFTSAAKVKDGVLSYSGEQ